MQQGSHNLVRRRIRERGGGKANPGVVGIVDVVEALQERKAVNEVKTLAALRAEVSRDEVDGVLLAANGRVELRSKGQHIGKTGRVALMVTYCARPDLGVGREFECVL